MKAGSGRWRKPKDAPIDGTKFKAKFCLGFIGIGYCCQQEGIFKDVTGEMQPIEGWRPLKKQERLRI